jgi:hypothetical protein
VQIAACATLETGGVLNASDQAFCSVRDVSMSGIGLTTGQPPLCGQNVRLRIALDDEIHELTARTTSVKRMGKGSFYHVGLDWTGCSTEQLVFLKRALAALQPASGS